MTCEFSLKNQDQDTGCPDSIFADFFWIFVVDSSVKIQKNNKRKKDPKGSPFDPSPLICYFHFTDYHVTCEFSLKNQDQDTGCPDSIFADFFWIFVVDSSVKIQKNNKRKKDPKGSPFDPSPLICNFHFTDYHMTCEFSLKNQDQHTGCPDSIFADFFLDFCS